MFESVCVLFCMCFVICGVVLVIVSNVCVLVSVMLMFCCVFGVGGVYVLLRFGVGDVDVFVLVMLMFCGGVGVGGVYVLFCFGVDPEGLSHPASSGTTSGPRLLDRWPVRPSRLPSPPKERPFWSLVSLWRRDEGCVWSLVSLISQRVVFVCVCLFLFMLIVSVFYSLSSMYFSYPYVV